jgi:hypothetical protein
MGGHQTHYISQTGALVGEIEDRLLVPTNYSPRSQLQVASLRGAK